MSLDIAADTDLRLEWLLVHLRPCCFQGIREVGVQMPAGEGRWTDTGAGTMLQTLGREGSWGHTAMVARCPKGPLTTHLTPLCQPGSA